MNPITFLIIILICSIVLAYILSKTIKKIKRNRLVRKAKTIKKRIKNINKHLKIADASKNLHEVRVHAREAMRLINKYGLVEDYREALNNRK